MEEREIDILLQDSLNHYLAILQHSHKLPSLLGCSDPQVFKDFVNTLQDMQEKARRSDNVLNSLPQRHRIDLKSHPLFQKRLRIIDEIIQHNNLHFPKIAGKMALVSVDLSQIKKGMTSISGYKSKIGGSGKIIDKAH